MVPIWCKNLYKALFQEYFNENEILALFNKLLLKFISVILTLYLFILEWEKVKSDFRKGNLEWEKVKSDYRKGKHST